jgi:nitrite reductase (NADH) small subunit
METKTTESVMSPVSQIYQINLGSISRIPVGEGRSFEIEGTHIAIFHTREGSWYATQGHCSHKGGPLADGLTGAGKIICPLHAYKFALATGEPLGHSCAALQIYPVSISPANEILLTITQEQLVQSRLE